MWIVYTMVGVAIGMGIAAIRADLSGVKLEMKRLEREITNDNLACAKEEHAAEVLRHIAENERQAAKGE